MSGLSIGWFETTIFHPRPDELATAIRRMMRRRGSKPFDVNVLNGRTGPAGAAYAMVNGQVSMSIARGGMPGAPNNDVFTFVLEVSGRPAIIATPYNDRTTPIMAGFAPPQGVAPVGLGMVELRAGMALHYDPSAQWVGFTSLPWEGQERPPAPHAVLLQVGGYPADDIAGACGHMALILNADMMLSSAQV